MSNQHPFLAAIQAAYDAHGLPDGVIGVTVSECRYSDRARFAVSMGAGRSYAQSTFGHGATVADAFAECAAKEAQIDTRAAEIAAARALITAAGMNADLVPA